MARYARDDRASTPLRSRGMVRPLKRVSTAASIGAKTMEHTLAPPVTMPTSVLDIPLAPRKMAAKAQHAQVSAHQSTCSTP